MSVSEELLETGEEWTYEAVGKGARLDGLSVDEAYERRWRERFRHLVSQRDQGLMPYALDSTLEDRAKEESRDAIDAEERRGPHLQRMHWNHAYHKRVKAIYDQDKRDRDMGLAPHASDEKLMEGARARAMRQLDQAVNRHEHH